MGFSLCNFEKDKERSSSNIKYESMSSPEQSQAIGLF